MNTDESVTMQQTSYRGVSIHTLRWREAGADREETFETQEQAVVAKAEIEERLRVAAMAGRGLTVNPFGVGEPFITSKDVHFASMRLQPRGLKFREAIEQYVAAHVALKGSDASVVEAARYFAEASAELKRFDVTVMQAVFEWATLKKQVGDVPLFEVLRVYLKNKDAAGAPAEANGARPGPAAGAA